MELTKTELGRELADAKNEIERRGAAWQADRDDKQSTVDNLMTELVGAQNANIALAGQRLEAEKKLMEVEANLAHVRAEFEDLQTKHKFMEADNEQLKLQTNDLAQKTATLDREKTAEIRKLQDDHIELDRRTKALQTVLDATNTARATLQFEKERMEGQFRDLEDGSPVVAQLRADKVDLMAQLETRTNGFQVVADRVLTLQQTNLELERTNEYLEKTQADLAMRLAAAQNEASLIPGLRDQIDRLSAQVHDAHDTGSSRKSHSSSRSNSSSRSSSKKHDRHSRSPSGGSGLLFVRNPSDKSGQVYITTRDALRRE